jgi:two-component sensor histidine kinase
LTAPLTLCNDSNAANSRDRLVRVTGAITKRSEQVDLRARVLEDERDRAERFLNRVRVVVLGLLAVAAAFYAPSLSAPLNRANLAVLLPTLAWTLVQYPLFYRRPALPQWLRLANPIVDITAVSALLWGYSLVESPEVAFKTPIFGAYFVILAALPVASSTRKATWVASLAVAQYALLLVGAAASGRLRLILDPVAATSAAAVSPLDEGAKLLLLACAGAVATYATRWQERLTAHYADVASQGEALKTRLERSELHALKLQLQPHFLFNTLNAITALVHTNADRAERMISGLSELLRASLRSAGEQEVRLARELDVLQHYVEIQQVRFQDRLAVQIDAPPEALRAFVPNLILQPLVENAIKHGLAPRATAGRVVVSAARSNGRLRLVVRDDGTGAGAASADRRSEDSGEGVGLANTRARLRSLYGEDHQFSAEPLPPPRSGFEVIIDLPYREEPTLARTQAHEPLP